MLPARRGVRDHKSQSKHEMPSPGLSVTAAAESAGQVDRDQVFRVPKRAEHSEILG